MSELNNNTPIYQSAFFIVPSHIIDLPDLSIGFLRVYETIFQFWNHNKTCFLAEEALCERTKLSRAQVYRALNYFENHNELIRRKINGKRYLVRPERLIETDCAEIAPKSHPCDVNVSSMRRSTSHPCDYNNKNINKEIKNNKTLVDSDESTTVNKSSKTHEHQKCPRFMRFYNAYPKKQDPGDAYKAFKTIVGKDDERLNVIIADIELRKAKHTQWQDLQYIKSPASYLRKGEYLGEIITKGKSTVTSINTNQQQETAQERIERNIRFNREEQQKRNAR